MVHIPSLTVSCALSGRVDWLHYVQFNPDGWQTASSEPFTGTHIHEGVCSSVIKERMPDTDELL